MRMLNILTALITVSVPTILPGQSEQQPNSLWAPVPRAELQNLQGARGAEAPSAQLSRLYQTNLLDVLRSAPLEDDLNTREDGYVEVLLPVPGNTLPRIYERFSVAESPLLPPELQSHVGGIKTYSGRGIDNPALTTRFSVSGAGITGIVLGGDRTWIIEPLDPETTQESDNAAARIEDAVGRLHVSVFRDELESPSYPLRNEGRLPPAALPAALPVDVDESGAQQGSPGLESRTFRLAVVATWRYTDFFRKRARGPISDQAARDSALAAILETMNLVQSLYQREFGVRFEFVPQQLDLIHVKPVLGFERKGVDSALLLANQRYLDAELTPAGYDIGHVFTVGDGGRGEISSLCDDSRKAQGATGLEDPLGKIFAVDYVSHEMGHQFGGRHTFNAVAESACSAATRSAAHAFEPGSGSTVMGYAGICGNSNVETESDQYFHTASLASITAHLQRTSCGRRRPINNRPPTVSTQSGWIIPKETPFVLTATGSDPDGDRLQYTWEEYYPGGGWSPLASPPEYAETSKIRPSFRSFAPTAEPSRMFPRLRDLAQGTVRFEALPRINRDAASNRPLGFRVTARDGRGGFGSTDVAVQVVARAGGKGIGPFVVTEPDAETTLRRGQRLQVTWNVANTDLAPINCSAVRISLDADQSLRFAETLVASTPNDGNEAVEIPLAPKSGGEARVKVECIGNIFFNISQGFQLRADP